MWALGSMYILLLWPMGRNSKQGHDQTMTGQVPPRSAQRATAACFSEGGKSGDRKTTSVCPNSLESAIAGQFFFFCPKFFGHRFGHLSGRLSGHLFGNLSSSVAPITPLGPQHKRTGRAMYRIRTKTQFETFAKLPLTPNVSFF